MNVWVGGGETSLLVVDQLRRLAYLGLKIVV